MAYASLNVTIILGHKACSANRSINVSSLAEHSTAPVFNAPIPSASASVLSSAFPLPSLLPPHVSMDKHKTQMDTNLLHGDKTREPIPFHEQAPHAGPNHSRRYHYNVAVLPYIEPPIKDVEPACNNYRAPFFQRLCYPLVKEFRLHLVWH